MKIGPQPYSNFPKIWEWLISCILLPLKGRWPFLIFRHLKILFRIKETKNYCWFSNLDHPLGFQRFNLLHNYVLKPLITNEFVFIICNQRFLPKTFSKTFRLLYYKNWFCGFVKVRRILKKKQFLNRKFSHICLFEVLKLNYGLWSVQMFVC